MDIKELTLGDEEIKEVKARVGLTDEGDGIFSMHIYDEERAISIATAKKIFKLLDDRTYGFDDGDGVMVYTTVWEEGEWEEMRKLLEKEG